MICICNLGFDNLEETKVIHYSKQKEIVKEQIIEFRQTIQINFESYSFGNFLKIINVEDVIFISDSPTDLVISSVNKQRKDFPQYPLSWKNTYLTCGQCIRINHFKKIIKFDYLKVQSVQDLKKLK